MASGFVTPAGDLDTLLMPLGSSTARANVGFLIAGQDAAQRYAPVAYGTAYGTTNFSCLAGDLGNLFAAAGSGGYSGTVTAGTITAGQAWGYLRSGAIGAVSPSTFRGNNINEIASNTSTTQTVFSIADAANPGSNYFTTLTFNGHALASSAATYVYSGGVATWSWPSVCISATGSYSLTIA